MPISIRPLTPVFAGEVAGVDCRRPLDAQAVAAIEAGMDRYAVLVFRDQPLSDEQQLAFTRQFGALENYATPGHIRGSQEQRLGPGMADFSNLDKDGNILSPEDRLWFFKLGDRLWHSDSSFRPVPAKYSILSGRVIPSWGANTEFADMRAAYDALDERTKAEIEDLVCEHSLKYSREAIGFTDLTEEEIAAFRPVRQRLVRTHPSSGRKSLFLASHAGHPRLDDPGSAHVPARPDRARHPARVRLLTRLAAPRPGDVGQPCDDAPRPPLRPQRGARRPPHHPRRRRADDRTGCVTAEPAAESSWPS